MGILVSGLLVVVSTGCGSDSGSSVGTAGTDDSALEVPPDAPPVVAGVFPAVEAVEAELGEGQEFFEVTSTAAGFVNVFVATDDGTAAVPYLYLDGELQPPAPAQQGASGNTFVVDDIAFDPDTVLDRLGEELPNTTVESFSVYGDGFGAVYVIAGRSEAGGLLDIVVTSDGAIVSVDPI